MLLLQEKGLHQVLHADGVSGGDDHISIHSLRGYRELLDSFDPLPPLTSLTLHEEAVVIDFTSSWHLVLVVLADELSKLNVKLSSSREVSGASNRPGDCVDEDRFHEFLKLFDLIGSHSSHFSVSVGEEEAVQDSAERGNQVIVNGNNWLFNFKSYKFY